MLFAMMIMSFEDMQEPAVKGKVENDEIVVFDKTRSLFQKEDYKGTLDQLDRLINMLEKSRRRN